MQITKDKTYSYAARRFNNKRAENTLIARYLSNELKI